MLHFKAGVTENTVIIKDVGISSRLQMVSFLLASLRSVMFITCVFNSSFQYRCLSLVSDVALGGSIKQHVQSVYICIFGHLIRDVSKSDSVF